MLQFPFKHTIANEKMLTVNSWLYHLQMCDVVQHFQRLCWFAISIDEVKIYLFGKESKSSWQKNKQQQQCQTVLKINLQNTLRSGSLRRVKLHSKQWPNNVTCTCNNILTSNIETVPYTPSLPPTSNSTVMSLPIRPWYVHCCTSINRTKWM